MREGKELAKLTAMPVLVAVTALPNGEHCHEAQCTVLCKHWKSVYDLKVLEFSLFFIHRNLRKATAVHSQGYGINLAARTAAPNLS